MELEKFDQLSAKLDRLLLRLDELNRSNQELSQQLSQKEVEIKGLKASLSDWEQERQKVRVKVDELLGRIEQSGVD